MCYFLGMTTATIQRELQELKERQSKLETAFYAMVGNMPEEEIRPEYMRKLERIHKDMNAGKGVTVIRTRKELKDFFQSL